MISYLVLHFWQDLYDESQARVRALERQLAALQVANDDDEEEEGADAGGDGDDGDAAEEDAEEGIDGDEGNAEEGGDDEDKRGDEEWDGDLFR